MVCIYCNGPTHVTNSRLNRKSNETWRRRLCSACGNIFSTYEAVDYAKTWRVVQSNGLVEFERDKLLLSLYKANAHRPTALTDAKYLSKTVISRLTPQAADGQITISVIAHEVLSVLQNFDKAAATFYEAYHATALR